MRITMNMTTNKMLMNINRNAMVVDKLYNQMTSGKKIQFPSDDPIIASRALKFRTNIAETEQYQRNVAQGLSWMEITEAGFTNVNAIMNKIRDLCVEGANVMELSDRRAIVTEILSHFNQVGHEMNIDYAGRFVFSGYRTDEPPTFKESNRAAFSIEQDLSIQDIEKTIAYMKLGVGQAPEVYENSSRLKLPYTNVTNLTVTAYDKAKPPVATTIPTAGTLQTRHLDNDMNTPPLAAGYTPADNPYTPGDDDIYYIPETGELILGKNVVDELNAKGQGKIQLTYDKERFDLGEPNPKVYFNCVQTKDDYGVAVTHKATAADVYRPAIDADVWHYATAADVAGGLLDADTGLLADDTTTPPSRVLNAGTDDKGDPWDLTSIGKLVVLSGKTDANGNALTPASIGVADVIGLTYRMTDANGDSTQEFQFEFGTATLVTVNNLAKNSLTASLFADLRTFCDDIMSMRISTEAEIRLYYRGDGTAQNPGVTPYNTMTDAEFGAVADKLIADHITEETQKYRDIIHDRFNNMLKIIDTHAAEISTEHTLLGSRMNRMDLIRTRLEQDNVSYTKLKDENENVDYLEVIMRFNAAQSVYQAALMSGGKITQMSLADYIR